MSMRMSSKWLFRVTNRHIDGALSRVNVTPLYVSVRTDVISTPHCPIGRSRVPVSLVNEKPPAQLTPDVFQNWLRARVVLLATSASSGGFSSLLTKSWVFDVPQGTR